MVRPAQLPVDDNGSRTQHGDHDGWRVEHAGRRVRVRVQWDGGWTTGGGLRVARPCAGWVDVSQVVYVDEEHHGGYLTQ